VSTSIPYRTIPGLVLSTNMLQDPIEEENLPYYNAKEFNPVQHGEIYNKRYQTIAKLGFGGSSTVWLAKDLNL
jgi:serine/threonine-protein kinase SRPK3